MRSSSPPDSAWRGGPVTPRAVCVLAPNPGPMTLDGTNTYVLAEPTSRAVIVVDPGPDDPEHLAAVADIAHAGGRRVALVLLTHGHLDHSGGAEAFAAQVRAPVRAADPALCRSAAPLAAMQSEQVVAERIVVEGLAVDVVPTPGHTADSVSFILPDDRALLTGDTVLGRGTTVVAHPDGRLDDYLRSLDRLAALVSSSQLAWLLPAHGPVRSDPAAVLDDYRAHRRERLDQVRAAVAAGATSARDVVEAVYADLDRRVWPAAERSVRAQLEYLEAEAAR